jgi:hypothetical protein
VPGEEAGLDGGEQGRGDSPSKELVVPFPLPGLLPFGQDELASVFGEADGAAGQVLEVVAPDLPAVEEGQGEPVGEDRAVFLHEVESEGWLAGSHTMQEADVRVQSYFFGAAVDSAAQQAVKE